MLHPIHSEQAVCTWHTKARRQACIPQLPVLLPPCRTYPRENPQCILDEKEVDMFRAYYTGIMYKVTTHASVLLGTRLSAV